MAVIRVQRLISSQPDARTPNRTPILVATPIRINHPGGAAATAYRGWSWTCFFFDPFPPIFRGDLKYFLIIVAVHIAMGFVSFVILFIPNIIFHLVVAAKYNDWHYYDLVTKGYRAVGT